MTTKVGRMRTGRAIAAAFAIAGCFEGSGDGPIAGAGGASAGAAAGGTSGGGGATGGTGTSGTSAGGTGAGGMGSGGTTSGAGGTSGGVCADCCAGIPNPQCAVVDCACPPVGGVGSGAGGTSGDVCADCCAGIPNPQCAVVLCNCMPGGGAGGTTATCDASTCNGFDCCGADSCVNLQNDINNCGTCGNACEGDAGAYCDNGTCGTAPCDAGMACITGTCCGSQCCGTDELCCSVPGPVAVIGPECVKPTEAGTCPMGCVLCDCNSPDTPIATPEGERAIASLREGDLVYSVDGSATVVVPLAVIVRNPVSQHEVVRVALDDGATVEISARHPLVDGRTVGDLRAGAEVAGRIVRAVEIVPYEHRFTYDILPASPSGAYYAGGVLVRSTLSP
jgi:hypothetical protein